MRSSNSWLRDSSNCSNPLLKRGWNDVFSSSATCYNISKFLSLAYLTFLMRMALSLRARSWDRILRSRFFRAKTRFSEFLMWWVCSRFMSRSIPLDCILRCITTSADSRFPLKTFTRIPRHCWSSQLNELGTRLGHLKIVETCLTIELISMAYSLCFTFSVLWVFGWSWHRL